MRLTMSLVKLLAFDNYRYYGEDFLVQIQEKEYSVLKADIFDLPRKLKHQKFNLHITAPATYLIREVTTGKTYVGSTGNVYERFSAHTSNIRGRKHDNKSLALLLKTSNLSDFEKIIIFTDDREEAFKLEQLVIDSIDKTLRLNNGTDVKKPLLGEKMSEETKKKMSNFRKTDTKAIEQFQKVLRNKRRRVIVNGKEYESLAAAGELSEFSETILRKKLRRNSDPNVYWLSDNQSPLSGRTFSQEQKQRLSEFRKTNSDARKQFENVRMKHDRKIILNGVLYDNILTASKATGIAECVIHRKLKKNGQKETEEILVLNYTPTTRQLIANGVSYETIDSACKDLAVSRAFIKKRIKSSVFYWENL